MSIKTEIAKLKAKISKGKGNWIEWYIADKMHREHGFPAPLGKMPSAPPNARIREAIQ